MGPHHMLNGNQVVSFMSLAPFFLTKISFLLLLMQKGMWQYRYQGWI